MVLYICKYFVIECYEFYLPHVLTYEDVFGSASAERLPLLLILAYEDLFKVVIASFFMYWFMISCSNLLLLSAPFSSKLTYENVFKSASAERSLPHVLSKPQGVQLVAPVLVGPAKYACV